MDFFDNSKLSNVKIILTIPDYDFHLNNLLKRLNVATTIATGRVKGKIDPNIKHSL